jgi:2,4-dienoyl-CoA reductase-like NADH-dependent reductase (Old Yellow Enzyme family)
MATPRLISDDVDPSPLSTPLGFAFSGRTAPNRLMKGAMSERLSSWSFTNTEARGIPSPTLIRAYQHWGEGGIGLILTGNMMIDLDHLEAPGNMIIPSAAPFSGERFDQFRDLAAAAKAHGSLVVAQVSHPGRQTPGYIQPHPISASEIQLMKVVNGETYAKPRAATREDIANIVEGFAHAAEYLDKAGYDGIQLHGAHGYLLSQFLSSSTNHRTDEYGGTLSNRVRLIIEIKNAISTRVRNGFIIGIKINSVEFQDKGFQPEEAKELCRVLEKSQFDFVELTGGTFENWVLGSKRASTIEREAVC